MSDSVRLEFLGTGTSNGVPVVGCHCAVCTSDNPKNQRYRPSVVVDWRGKRLLIDTPPELRLQLLRARISYLDALLYTHTHADHLFGLDDIRAINQLRGGPLPVYGSVETLERLRQQFYYVFVATPAAGGKPSLDLREIAPLDGPFQAEGVPVQAVPIMHGSTPVLGFRFGNLAYLTDTNQIPESSFQLLQGLDILVIDALREARHPTHFSVGEALEVTRRLRPRRTYFTHICHDLEHESANQRLPAGVEVAFDGLVVETQF